MSRLYTTGYEEIGITPEEERMQEVKEANDALRKYLSYLMKDCDCKEGNWHMFSLYVMRTPNSGFVISDLCLVEVPKSPSIQVITPANNV